MSEALYNFFNDFSIFLFWKKNSNNLAESGLAVFKDDQYSVSSDLLSQGNPRVSEDIPRLGYPIIHKVYARDNCKFNIVVIHPRYLHIS